MTQSKFGFLAQSNARHPSATDHSIVGIMRGGVVMPWTGIRRGHDEARQFGGGGEGKSGDTSLGAGAVNHARIWQWWITHLVRPNKAAE